MREPYVLALGAAATVAILQAVLARWRDLAPAVVALGGIALLLGPLADPRPWAGLAAVAVLSAVAGWRSARAGIARPELVGVSAAVVVVALAVAVALPGVEGLRAGLAGAAGLVGLLLTGVSLARLGARGVVVRWTGEIPVSGPPAPPPVAPPPAPAAPGSGAPPPGK